MTYTTQHGVEVPDWSSASQEEVREGYRQMVLDKEREADAFDWIEAHIGDGLEAR